MPDDDYGDEISERRAAEIEEYVNGEVTAKMPYEQYVLIAACLAENLTKEDAKQLDSIEWKRTR